MEHGEGSNLWIYEDNTRLSVHTMTSATVISQCESGVAGTSVTATSIHAQVFAARGVGDTAFIYIFIHNKSLDLTTLSIQIM